MSVKRQLAVVAGVALVAGAGCFGEAWRSAGQQHLMPAVSNRSGVVAPRNALTETGSLVPTAPTTTVSTSSNVGLRAPTRVAPPVRVEIPVVGLSAAIVPVGLTASGDMEIPLPTIAGWYELGPAPGAVGPAVLVGHVDSKSGPAVFYRLTAVHVGDTVVVERADGSRARFLISAVTVVRKAVFPIGAVFAPTPVPSLRLITCTGPFDPRSHHYTDSLIAWAEATS
jgi:Sortase domain